MNELPQALYLSSQVRELDRLAIEEHGIPGYALMQRAGAAAMTVLAGRWPRARRLCVVCGSGNNGGDGLVLARLAHAQGYQVRVLQVAEPDQSRGDAHQALDDLVAAGVTPQRFAAGMLSEVDVIVDALLGIGVAREVQGPWRKAIDMINIAGVPVLSVDVPSGLQADSGAILGAAVRADATVSFIGLKTGLFTGEGRACCGEVYFDDLEVPAAIYDAVTPVGHRLLPERFDWLLAPRRPTAHKGDFGHVLVVGGNHGMSGAVRLAAEAAARGGAGLVSVATRDRHAAVVNTGRPELMCHAVEEAAQLEPLLERATVIAIGPGLGQDAWAKGLFARVLESRLPLVVDADALNLLARNPVARGNWVLTPHPGEAARLLETNVEDVESERLHSVRALTRRYGGAVVLKGAGSLVVTDEGMIGVCENGNPGMASGGMGDVLSGVIAALLAQGHRLADAARIGTYVHAAAGDRAAREGGERGLLAGDLFPHLRRLLNPAAS